MALDQGTEMAATEIDDLLGRLQTGVLSLARDDRPYAIPISYGFDSDAGAFYLRLVSTDASEKRRFLSSSPPARLVVYEEDGAEYRSVVAEGRLEQIPREELTVEHIEQYGGAKRPLFEIWGESTPDLDIQLYVLDPDHISGRYIEVDSADGG